MSVRTVPRGLPRRAPAADKSFVVADLTGGLDLNRDGAQLDAAHSSDMMNVEPLIGGGIRRRNAVTVHSTPIIPVDADALSVHALSDGWQQVLMSSGGDLYQCEKGAFTSKMTASVVGAGAIWRTVQVYGKSYCYSSTRKYDGSVEPVRSYAGFRLGAGTVASLAATFNNTTPKYGTYSSGGVPTGLCMAFWHGRLWTAATTESGTFYPNRIRFSYPIVNNVGAEDWHVDDYIQADETSDPIIALVPHGDKLLIFKAGSIDQIEGWDETNFVRTNVATGVGTRSMDSITMLGIDLYFWDVRYGLCVLVQQSPYAAAIRPRFDTVSVSLRTLIPRIVPPVAYDIAIDPPVGTFIFGPDLSLAGIPTGGQIYLGAVRDRIWCSVVLTDDLGVGTRYTYVYDPTLSQGGSWMVFDLQVGPFLTAFKEARKEYGNEYIAGSRNSGYPKRLMTLEVENADSDDYGTATASIQSWYRTGWMANDGPFTLKRWGLVQGVLQAGTAQSFALEVYANWEPLLLRDSLTFANPFSGLEIFTDDVSILAPTSYEQKRPSGVAGPGTNTVVTLATLADINWDSTIATWDDPRYTWDGVDTQYVVAAPSIERYDPDVPAPVPCDEDPGGYAVLGGSTETSYEFGIINIPAARALQVRVVGASPSKPWALRAIMFTYREVFG